MPDSREIHFRRRRSRDALSADVSSDQRFRRSGLRRDSYVAHHQCSKQLTTPLIRYMERECVCNGSAAGVFSVLSSSISENNLRDLVRQSHIACVRTTFVEAMTNEIFALSRCIHRNSNF